MNRVRKVIPGVRRFSRILELIESGANPKSVRDEMRAVLQSVFERPSILDEIQPEIAINEAVNVQRILADPWDEQHFRQCLSTYRAAYARDADMFLTRMVDSEPTTRAALKHYWSLIQLEQGRSELAFEDYVAHGFRNIGTLLEACLQPYLKELLQQVRVARGEDPAGIERLDFGLVISELYGKLDRPDLVAPPPWRVRLNQWRNTPQHFNYEVVDQEVRCWYGKGDAVKRFVLSADEFVDAQHRMIDIFRAVRTARTIFVLDNLQAVRERIPPGTERQDAAFFSFATLASMQGFEVVDGGVDAGVATATLRDVTNQNPKVRMGHASQFVVQLWRQTSADECVIEYQDQSGRPRLRTRARGEDCGAVIAGTLPMEELARRVELTDLSHGVIGSD